MLEQHVESGAGVTVAALRVPVAEAHQFGILRGGDGTLISEFQEKPSAVEGLPDDPGMVFGSMGNYVFRTETLLDVLNTDALDSGSAHDVGGSVIPMLVAAGSAHSYDFTGNVVPGATERDRGYWRDVGTIDAFHASHMDLVDIEPVFNLYNRSWPILTSLGSLPPAKFVLGDEGRTGQAIDSMVCAGAIVSGGTVRRSVISPNVRIEQRAVVEDSVILHDVQIGDGAIVRRAIIDKGVVVPPGAQIGVDPQADAARFRVSEGGVVVIGKHQVVERN
jgi:glucose-1-phosphate adenylyltransferase